MEPVQTIQSVASASPGVEPCPTPLDWRDVVARFRDERDDFELDVDGRQVRGAVFGSGPPLYLLNPATGDLDLYALLAWTLRDQFRCVLFNYPPPSRQRCMRWRQAETSLHATADHVGDGEFSLLAAGWGSVVALRTLVNRPRRVPAAILVGGFAHRDLTWMERGLLAWGEVCPGSLGRLPGWRDIQERNHRPWFPPFDETRWEFLRDNLGATPIRDAARRLALLATTDLRPQLTEIETPVLIVGTEGEGPLLTKCRADLEAGLPGASVECLHTSGHYSCLTHPHRLAKLVSSFLQPPTSDL